MAKATARALDMTDVKDGSKFNKKRQPEGDYRGKITSVEDAKPKDKSDKTPMWLFTIKVGTGVYPYYCKLQDNQLWKVRNLAIAAGMSVPKKRIKLDPNKLVGKDIAVTLEDDEYEGKSQSEISAVFPLSELDADDDEYDEDEDEDEEDDEDEDEEDEDEEDEDEEDEVDEDEEEDEEDEEDEEEEAEPAPRKKKKAKAKTRKRKPADDDDDDDLDEIDIDDV